MKDLRGWKLLAIVAALATLQGGMIVATHAAVRLADRSDWPVFRWADSYLMFSDVPLYFNHANRVFEGEVPYRDHLIEYPVLALPFLFLPRLFTSDQRLFVLGFAAEMVLVNAAILYLVARRVVRSEGPEALPGRLAWYTAYFAAVCPFVVGRFDAAPAAFAFASACWWFSGRPGQGGLMAGLGTLVKIVPGAVALPGLIWEATRRGPGRWRGALAFGLSLAVGVAFWLALGGPKAFEAIRYHTERGLEVGSIYSGALRLAYWDRGEAVFLRRDHESMNLITPASDHLAAWAFPIQAAALLLVGWRAWRSGMREPLRFAAAAVLAFAITGKVLSPQYLLWVLPFVVALPGRVGRGARPLFLAACLASMAIYPWAFYGVLRLDLRAFAVLNLRNVMLLALLAWLLFARDDPAPERSGAPLASVGV